MTSVRLLTAVLLLCTASTFAQEQLSSVTRASQTAEPQESPRNSEPWKIVRNQPADLSAGKNRPQQFQIDAYKIDQFRIGPNRRPFRWGSQNDPILIEPAFLMYGQLGDDTVCYKIRSYVVARDNKDSDSVHPVGYSTCQPASRYRLKKTQIQTGSSAR